MPHDLMQTFREVVRLFNRFDPNNWEYLEPLLHDDIKMKRIDELTPNSYHEGKPAVQRYLCCGNGKDDQAVFELDELDGPPDHQEIGNYGFVSGVAWFIDKTYPDPETPVKRRRMAYSFIYKRGDDKDTRNWQEIHSWGKYEHKITKQSK